MLTTTPVEAAELGALGAGADGAGALDTTGALLAGADGAGALDTTGALLAGAAVAAAEHAVARKATVIRPARPRAASRMDG